MRFIMKRVSDYITEDSINDFIIQTCKKRNGKKAYVCDMRQFYNWTRLSKYKDLDLDTCNLLMLYKEKLFKTNIKDNTIKRKITILKEYIIYRSIPLPGMLAVRSIDSGRIYVYDREAYEFFYQDDFFA